VHSLRAAGSGDGVRKGDMSMSGRLGFGWVIVLRWWVIGGDVLGRGKREVTRVFSRLRSFGNVCKGISIRATIYLAMQGFS